MMKQRVARVAIQLLTIVSIFAMASCSVTKQAIKSGDPQIIYEKAIELYEGEDWTKASKLFESAQPYYSGTQREDTLAFYNARCKFKNYAYDEAMQKFDDFRRKFGRSAFLEDSEGMYTLCYYYMSPVAERDQATTQSAIIAIDEFLSRYPESRQVENFKQLREDLILRLHKKTFINAYSYYKIGKYKSAIVAFKNAKRKYPESGYREEISFYTVASSFELADNSVLSKKEDRFLQMLDSYYTLIGEFPESSYRKEADNMVVKAKKYLDHQNAIREGSVEVAEDEEEQIVIETKRERREREKHDREASEQRIKEDRDRYREMEAVGESVEDE